MLYLELPDYDEEDWKRRMTEALKGYRVVHSGDEFAAEDVHYIMVRGVRGAVHFEYPNLKAILSLAAGVDGLLARKDFPRDVPLVRFVDDELSQCMSEYVLANVLMHHRLQTRFNLLRKTHTWSQLYPPPASTTTVGVMGLGVLGLDAIKHLKNFGFKLRGWSRSPKTIEGVTTFAGEAAFDAFLSETDILVNLLPLTPETTGILNYDTFSKLKRDGLEGGPAIINAARGKHQVEEDIVRALDDGTLAAASLDVFVTEPLPKDSPLWDHERCYITAHSAAGFNTYTGVDYYAKIINDHLAGKPLANVVDTKAGY